MAKDGWNLDRWEEGRFGKFICRGKTSSVLCIGAKTLPVQEVLSSSGYSIKNVIKYYAQLSCLEL